MLDTNGGYFASDQPTSISKQYGETLGELPTPVRTRGIYKPGYALMEIEFVGWYTQPEGGDVITSNTKVTDNLNIYAHWNMIYRERSVSRIEVSSFPEKTSYSVGESFDTTGLEITAYYNDRTDGAVKIGIYIAGPFDRLSMSFSRYS